VVEAMASGTPVIAFDRGSMTELIDDGVTGFVVQDMAAAVSAVDKANGLLRPLIRDIAVARFDSNRMVDEYVALYRRVLGGVSPPVDLGTVRGTSAPFELVAR
jgi:glycosyltransferase involved in cell wall biosynthesis